MTESADRHASGEERAGADRVDADGREDGEAEQDREPDDGDESSHLDGVEDGAGCTEIWERLSENRENTE
ncbi:MULTISPECIES: hypothetical protein [Halorubrum]|uniref:Uncharacterized protein n=1 Tax=Halorubrum hochstenium ATCC 700873 TaxID=1227481 RepID=M0F2E0_9EURY|nr:MULTISPECIES: hypothetical protein [Halorubrum]ELZ53362.1 hypothetical protein C467_13397 [Halorubrum hochstenium ATCC 700873]